MDIKFKYTYKLAVLFVAACLLLQCRPAEIRSRPNNGTQEFSEYFDAFSSIKAYEASWNLQIQTPYGKSAFKLNHHSAYIGENRVELQSVIQHSGVNAVKFSAEKSGRYASKADIQKGGFHFAEDDDFWTSFWLYIEGSADLQNLFIFDIETTQVEGSPGRRIMFSGEDAYLKIESKTSGPDFIQKRQQRIALPRNKWVHLTLHLYLHHKQGLAELWQDGTLLIQEKGQTLPEKHTIYNRMQYGITACGKSSTTLFIDDVIVSAQTISIL